MGKKTDSATEKLHILVIADRQRLRSLFDFCAGMPLVQLSTAPTIEEGMRMATAKPPSLLFIQGRMGGLSGEIIARHIRQELKQTITRLFLFRDEEDAQTSANRSLFTAIDASVPDDQLAAEVHDMVASLLPGARKDSSRRKKMAARKAAPDIPRQSSEPNQAEQGPDREVADIVEIRSNNSLPEAQSDESSRSAAERSAASSFREKLDVAMEISATTITGEKMAESGRDVAAHHHVFHGTREVQAGERSGAGIPGPAKSRGKRWIVLSIVLLSGIMALFLFYGITSAPQRAGETGQPAVANDAPNAEQDIRSVFPVETDTGKPDKKGAGTPPVTAEQRKDSEVPSTVSDAGYLKYTVQRGDTLVTILTKRFGLSARMAESLIPEILEKNGITRRTVLSIGQNLLIPAAVKI
jgi:CheY-like chemotaxis protein